GLTVHLTAAWSVSRPNQIERSNTMKRALQHLIAMSLALCGNIIISSHCVSAQTNATSQPLFPKYLVVGVVYAPPGASSSVTYSNSDLVGSSNTVSTTNSSTVVSTTAFSSSAELGLFGASVDYASSDGWTTSSQ